MKIKGIISLALVAILAIGSVNSVSAKDNNGSGKEELQDARKTRLQQDSIRFDKVALQSNQLIMFYIEQQYICKGESTRVKVLVDPSRILKFEIFEVTEDNLEGVKIGEMSDEDLKKGELILTIKPEKTTYLKYRMHIVIGQTERNTTAGKFIAIVDADKVEDIVAKNKELVSNRDFAGINQHTIQTVGEEFYNAVLERVKRENGL